MKVCRVVDYFPIKEEIKGGLGPNYFYYSKLTVERGIDVEVICGRKVGQPEKEVIDGIRIHRISPARSIQDKIFGRFASEALKKIREIKPDIIHGHNALHFCVAKERERLKIPVITHLHGIIDLYKYTDELPFSFNFARALRDRIIARWYYFENKFVTKKADLVIACDNFTSRSVKRYFKEKQVNVVYNGVDIQHFRRRESNMKQELGAEYLLLYVGRPTPLKGIQYLLKALEKLNKEYANLKCLLLGAKEEDAYDTVYYRWLKSIAEELGLLNVIFAPPESHITLPQYYSGVDCLVMPSYPDCSPKVVYEAQACSCPVVATNGGGIPEIFSENSGLLFKPRDIDDMIEKIRVVLDNPEKFRGGRKVIEEQATWEKCVEDIIKCYELIY